jgi:hypothetical protein
MEYPRNEYDQLASMTKLEFLNFSIFHPDLFDKRDRNKFSYVDSIGYFHVVGEVQNNAPESMKFVDITATFYDAAGKVVGTDFGYTDMDTLLPAQTSPFEILLTDEQQSQKIDNYKLSVSGDQTFESKPANLKLNVGDSFTDSINNYHVVGEVTNQGDEVTKFVRVAGDAFYNDQNRLVAVGSSYTDPSDLSLGATAPFEILVTVLKFTKCRPNNVCKVKCTK